VHISNVTTHGAASAGRAVVGTLGGEGGGVSSDSGAQDHEGQHGRAHMPVRHDRRT
jgi:hypothetical protein